MSNARFMRALGSGMTTSALLGAGLLQMQGHDNAWALIMAGVGFMVFAAANIYVGM